MQSIRTQKDCKTIKVDYIENHLYPVYFFNMLKTCFLLAIVFRMLLAETHGYNYKEYSSIDLYSQQEDVEGFIYIRGMLYNRVSILLTQYNVKELENLNREVSDEIRIFEAERGKEKHIAVYSELSVIINRIIEEKDTIHILKDIHYNIGEYNTLDIYLSNKVDAPLILYVHGGGWKAGDKKNDEQKGKYFAENGVNFVSVNYSLYPESHYREQGAQLAQAFTFMRNNGEMLHMLSDDITLMGHSAGGHLVSMLALDPYYLEHEGYDIQDITRVISLDAGGYDINKVQEKSKNQFNMFYKDVFGIDEEELRKASPISYLKSKRDIANFYIYSSSQRGENHTEIQKDFYNAIILSGNEAEIYFYTFDHEDFNNNLGDKNFPEYSKSILGIFREGRN